MYIHAIFTSFFKARWPHRLKFLALFIFSFNISSTEVQAQSTYQDGVKAYLSEQYEKAYEIFKVLAEQGDNDAQYYMGELYQYGDGVKQSDKKAFEWYKKSADQGDLDAQNKIGEFYLDGIAVKKSGKEALEWFLKAAEQGQPLAQLSAGIIYENGDYVEQSFEQAAYWYQKSADQNDELAQAYLGELYEKGQGVDRNIELAIELYEKSIAAGGDDYGAERLSELIEAGTPENPGYSQGYINGLSFYKNGNINAAIKIWSEISQKGDRDAQMILGTLYELGKGDLVPSHERAVYWYKKAALQNLGSAQYGLGVAYGSKENPEANDELAKFWLRKAADNGIQAAKKDLAKYE